MKKIFTVLISLCCLYASAQNVGINTNSPAATLQVVGKPTDNTKVDGIMIPTLTGDQLKAKDAAYTSQNGAMVFVTAAVGTASTKTANVTASGFYYFDGSVWQRVATTSAIDTTNDAFVNDAANTMVKLKTTADGVTSRATGAEFVIKDDGKVGIGTTTPGRLLDVNGTVYATDEIFVRRSAEGGQLTLQGQTTTDANWTIDQINNSSNPRFRIFGGSSENNGISITQAGNVSAPNGWVRGFAPGQLLNSVFVDDPPMSLPVNFNSATFTDLINYTYTPVFNNSKIMVQYHNNNYTISGGAGADADEFQTQMLINGSAVTANTQQSSQSSGSVSGTFRTGTLFPIVGVSNNNATTSILIRIQVRKSSGDDGINFNGTNGTLIIQEIAR